MKLLDILYRCKNWIAGLFQPLRLEKELEIEMQHHLAFSKEHYEREGMSSNAAKKAALKGFGNVESLKEDCRDSWGTRVINDFIRDCRYSARMLRNSKGFSFAVVITLALCIGANITIFSALYHLVLRQLPFEEPENLVRIHYVNKETASKKLNPGNFLDGASYSQYQDYKAETDLFENISLHYYLFRVVDSSQLKGVCATASFFDVMRVEPILGRFYTEEEMYPSTAPVVVLSETLWRTKYASDPDIIGKSFQFLNKPPLTIIGVAPQSLETLDRNIRFFTPYHYRLIEHERIPDSAFWARLKPGVSPNTVSERLLAIETHWNEEKADTQSKKMFERDQRRFRMNLSHPFENQLLMLQFGAFLVLLIGCVNVTNLLLGRAKKRQFELSIRHSCGASSVALGRMMFCESMILAFLGAIIGTVFSWVGLFSINNYLTSLDATTTAANLNATVFVWISVTATVISFLMGLIPLALLWKSGSIQKIDNSSRASSFGKGAKTFSNGLVVLQVAMTCALLIGAGLLFRSLTKVSEVDPGFDPSGVLQARIKLREVYEDRTKWVGVRNRILEVMREIPGVESVSFRYGTGDVFTKYTYSRYFAIRGVPLEPGEVGVRVHIKWIDGTFFETMGIPLLHGRTFFLGGDEPGRFIVDETFVEKYLPGKDPLVTELDRRSSLGGGRNDWGRIVGVVGRANLEGQDRPDGLPIVYQNLDNNEPLWGFLLTIRTTRSLDSITPEMQSKLKEIHPQLHLYDPMFLDEAYHDLNLERRGITWLVGLFAVLAVLLSAVGIYGVLSFSVEQRRREIGIRSAIGASRREILSMILVQGLVKTGSGLVVGIIASFYLTRFLESQLFNVSTLDLGTYLSAPVMILLISLLASYLPARKAVKIDPHEALRAE
ncbi:MAG: ADOP family duplicated permease [Opitutales bacterium]|nr:ADOP family duplicated permease [Opitutales bacterium]